MMQTQKHMNATLRGGSVCGRLEGETVLVFVLVRAPAAAADCGAARACVVEFVDGRLDEVPVARLEVQRGHKTRQRQVELRGVRKQ
jgi:hypothetical protein